MENTNPWFKEGGSKARLVWVTPQAEEHIAYIARVSNPKNQSNEKFEGLIKYCINHGHVSVFEHAYMCVEIITPLAIATQMLRHRSFCFQQFSLRYSDHSEMSPTRLERGFIPESARLQDLSNRQNSLEAHNADLDDHMWSLMDSSYNVSQMTYKTLLDNGIAKEIARFVLPQGFYTRLYATGNARSWMHYLRVREEVGVVQSEHVDLARAVRRVFSAEFPLISSLYLDEQVPIAVL